MHLDILHPAVAILSLLSSLPPSSAAHSASKPKNAILLSEVQSLTFRSGAKTTHRRVPSIPQLKCVSPARLCALQPPIDVMRCQNQGAGYGTEDIQWSCTASLPSTLKLGSTEVICEGYASPEDPYVLRGSCGVEYRLVLTDEGEKRHPDLAGKGGDGETDWAGIVFGVIFFAVVAWIIYGACTAGGAGAGQARRRQPRARGGWGGGGGGGGGWGPGGGGGGDDPPPPYPGTKPDGGTGAAGDGWRPGFWSGLAGGAAAGYLAGGGRNRQDNGYNTGGGGGLFGGGNNNYGTTWGGSGGGSSRTASGSSSSSRAQHQSTGFGSTSRR